MKSFFFSVKKATAAVSLGILLLRLGFGVLMIPAHGYAKLANFASLKGQFMDFMGLGGTITLALVIFAEFFCSILIALGLFTRLAAIPLIFATIMMMSAHNWEIFGKYELATAYFIAYVSIFAMGPGAYSMDYLLFKRKR